MGVFQRKASTSSVASGSAKPAPPSRSNSAKPPKPTTPSLVQRVSSSVKPTPKPRPSLLRRATTGLSEMSTSSWEKRTLKRLQKFPRDHPLLMQVLGSLLCIVGAGASAVTMPGLLAAIGAKLAVVQGSTMLASSAATGAVVQGSAIGSALAAGAKILASTIAMDVGGKLLAGPPSPQRFGGLFGKRRRNSSSDSGRVGVLSDVPLLPPRK